MESFPELMTSREVQAALRVTRVTVSRWAKDGTLPVIRLGSRAIRFRREDVLRMLTPETEGAA